MKFSRDVAADAAPSVPAKQADGESDDSAGKRLFAETHWSLVELACGAGKNSERAWEFIAKQYWAPLYAYARRWGLSEEDAADSTQSFFRDAIASGLLHTAEQEKGRLRTFLLTVFQRQIGHERQRAGSWKRGGRAVFLSMGLEQVEAEINATRSSELSPDALYDRQWAITITAEAMARLERHSEAAGKGTIFRELRPHVAEDTISNAGHLRDAALRLDMIESSLRVALLRLRRRFRICLLEMIGETLGTRDEAQIHRELIILCDALS